ncbi:MAG: hypothetical protein K9L74_06930 [Candidatus Izimaplasma sp.]|nr:hypothetical protein [Candidatus Izimaplasma bacterium]
MGCRWDNDYTDMDFWSWGTGTNGSENPQIVGEDDFGSVAYLCVDDDAEAEAGLIPRLNDWSYKDGVDLDEDGGGDDKAVPLRDENGDFIGFDENGIKHVYILQGQEDVYTVDESMPYFQKEGFGTLVVVYYDPAESYDGWNIWNWGTGTDGTAAGDAFGGSGVPFQYDLGVDQGQDAGKFKVAVFNVAADAEDEMGFIVRTDSWEKKYADDLFIDISGIKGSGTQFTFYIAGEGEFYNNFADFENVVNFFEISSARALDPTSIEVVFNKEVVTMVDDVDVFDETTFTVTDKDGNTVPVDFVAYDSTTEANTIFTVNIEESLSGDMSPYTVTYSPEEGEFYAKEFTVDSIAPTITIIGSTNVELELGDSYSLPTYTASDISTDDPEEEPVQIYSVKVKDGYGTVDTRNTGVYEVVITAEDTFGNVSEETITVTVIDPCADFDNTDANNGFGLGIISLVVGLPLAFVGLATLRRG